jgi:hypothetical protein
MSDRPTPETDQEEQIDNGDTVPLFEFCRKLERQRDAANSRFESSQHARMELKRERDEARELARELRDKLRALTDECLLCGFNQEWDTFVEAESALTKAKELLP